VGLAAVAIFEAVELFLLLWPHVGNPSRERMPMLLDALDQHGFLVEREPVDHAIPAVGV
jgi:hypothetical protein